MNRRQFMQGLLGGIATVAIATKLAPKFPKFEYKTYGKSFVVSRQKLENTLLTPEEISQRMAEALAKSMMQTKENVAMRVFWDNEKDNLHFEGISREEYYA